MTKLERLRDMGRQLRAQRHDAKRLHDEMPANAQRAWTKQVIDPITTAIDNIETILVRGKKLLRKQGFVRVDQTFGGLL